MFVFIDTEFTSLDEPYLISAALISAAGKELYFELAGVAPQCCSSFVLANVLPLLHGHQLRPIEAAAEVEQFFSDVTEMVTLFSDAPRYDAELLKPFLPMRLSWRIGVPSFENDEDEAKFNFFHQKAFESGLRRHHALDDARALRLAWNAVTKAREDGHSSSEQQTFRK